MQLFTTVLIDGSRCASSCLSRLSRYNSSTNNCALLYYTVLGTRFSRVGVMLLPQSLYGVQYTRRTIHSKSKHILGNELFLNARHNSVEESCLTFKRIATKTGEILKAVLLVGESTVMIIRQRESGGRPIHIVYAAFGKARAAASKLCAEY